MYEHRSQSILPLHLFVRRVLRTLLTALILIILSLGAGTWGYHAWEGLEWVDAFYNASLILSGMGPAATLQGAGSKIFASLYALYSGLFFIAISGLLLAPVLHRILHRIHVENSNTR